MSSSADDASCDTALLSSQNNSRPVRRCRLISIEPVMFLASIAVGMLVPVTQQYIYKRMSEDYAQEHVIDNTTTRIVEQQSSKWVMYLTLSFLIPSFFSSLILGSCSDQFGRKSVLLFPFIGSASRQLVTIIVVGFNLNVAYLFIGNVMDGICGGTGVIVMSCFAYLSDITTHQQRTIRVVILECSGSIGLILGSLVTGYLIRYFGFLWPNVVIVILTAVTVLYIIFVIENNTKQNSQSGVTKLNHLWEPLKLYLKDDGTHRRWKLTLIMFIMFLVMIVDFGRLDCESFHLLSYPFSWNSVKIGYYSATVQLMRMLASVILARLIMHWTGDLGLLLISCLSGVIYEILFALAESIGVIFLAAVAGSAIALSYAVARSFMSKLVQPHEQGKLYALVAWTQLVSVMIGSITFNSLYMRVVAIDDAIVFFVMAGVFGVAACLSLVLLVGIKKSSRYHLLININNE